MIVINPGSGPVDGATLDHAYDNMQRLIEDAGLTGATFARDSEAEEEDDGRFSFRISVPGGERFGTIAIEMPGIPLAEVRWMKEPGQNIWDFPRLYVNGSSWVWFFAVRRVREWLSDNEDHEEEERKRLLEIRRERETDSSSQAEKEKSGGL